MLIRVSWTFLLALILICMHAAAASPVAVVAATDVLTVAVTLLKTKVHVAVASNTTPVNRNDGHVAGRCDSKT